METKECGFSGFKMNGFLALFLHLVVLTAVIIFGFIISVPTLILSVCLCLCRLYGAGAERGACYGVLW